MISHVYYYPKKSKPKSAKKPAKKMGKSAMRKIKGGENPLEYLQG